MEELLDRVLGGDKCAYNELINMISSELYYIAKSQLKSKEDIEEAIQETLLKAYKNLHTLKNKKFFKTWIIRILISECKNIHINNYKQLGIFSKIIYFRDFKDSNDSDNNINDFENNWNFKNILDILNDDEKLVIILYFKYRYTTEEISFILHKNINTVRSQYRRAKCKINDYIRKEKYDESKK